MKTATSVLLVCAGLSLGQAAVGVLYIVIVAAAFLGVATVSLAVFSRLRPSQRRDVIELMRVLRRKR